MDSHSLSPSSGEYNKWSMTKLCFYSFLNVYPSEDLMNAWPSWNKALQFQTSATNDSLVQNILQIPVHILFWHSSVFPWLASIPEVWPNQCYRYLVEQNRLIPQPSAVHHLLELWKAFQAESLPLGLQLGSSPILNCDWKLGIFSNFCQLRLKTRNCDGKLAIFSNSLFVNYDWKLRISNSSTATESSESSPTLFSTATENLWTDFQGCETRCSRILRHGYHSYDIIGCHAEYVRTCTYIHTCLLLNHARAGVLSLSDEYVYT